MERSYPIIEMNANTATSCKKLKGLEDEQEDRISSLPDSILLHILSFLPMNDAVKTMLLRRFGNLWSSIQTLDFDGRSYDNFANARQCRHNKWFTDFVNHVLCLQECPAIFKFSLKFGSYLYFSPKDISPHRHKKPLKGECAANIDSWICCAVRKKVKVLDLAILAHGSSSTLFDYEVPDAVLTSDFLADLKLVNIGLRQEGQVHMRSLKTLSLTTIMLSDTMMEQILSGCPLLESLSIIQCYGLRKLNCTSSYLKYLMLVLGEDELARLEICGPNLMSFHISGLEGCVDLKNLSSLVEATLDLCFGGTSPVEAYYNVWRLLEKLHHANIFTICNWCILMLSFWELKKTTCPSSSRKCLVLKTMLTKWHLPGIASLLRHSPNLEMLSINVEVEVGTSVIFTADDLRLGISGVHEDNFWKDKLWCLKSYNFDEENYWNSQLPFSCLRNHLKIVKISGCVSNSYLLQLVKFLLGYSTVLEKILISTKHSNQSSHCLSKELLEFCQKLSSFPKASDRSVILFC